MSDREQCKNCLWLSAPQGKNGNLFTCNYVVPDWAAPNEVVDPEIFRTCPCYKQIRTVEEAESMTGGGQEKLLPFSEKLL